MSFEPDPRAVLKHLHDLGYYNITPLQLQEFMKDLKKLMKYYETTKKKLITQDTEDSTSSNLPNTTDESLPNSPPPHPTMQRSKHRNLHLSGETCRNESEEESCSCSETSIPSTRRILRECTKLAAEKSQQKVNVLKDKTVEASKVQAKPSKSCDCVWRKIGCKCCEDNFSKEQHSIKTAKSKENFAPSRPKSSFIRTWQLTGQARPGSAPQRSDPVALYQQYQQLWKQQKLPGENNHNDLRWSIRERMLGQEPHPRSCCCPCNYCPCKLKESDLPKDPKKVSSKLLPRGPFHVDGRILGPLELGKDGEFVVTDRHLQGIFELGNGSFCGTKNESENPSFPENKVHDRQERATWLSKEELDKGKQTFDRHHDTNHKVVTDDELKSCRNNHNKSTCKYCGLIHYMLHSDGSNSYHNSTTNSSKNSYWPQQFTAKADVHRDNNVTPTSRPPTATSTPLSAISRQGNRRVLNLASPCEPAQQKVQKCNDNYFTTKIPIILKDFKGEVKTEIEVFKRKGAHATTTQSSETPSEPLVVVATEVKINKI